MKRARRAARMGADQPQHAGMPAALRAHPVGAAAHHASGMTLRQISDRMGDVTPSMVRGPWTVDRRRALADAQSLLSRIDFTKRDIVLWVPGTDNHAMHPALGAEIAKRFNPSSTHVDVMQYDANWNVRDSLPTGIRTLRLVLAAIQARGGGHRVLLAGESQGAWTISESIADPFVGRVVSRAVLLGHPASALTHFGAGADEIQDPRVLEIANPLDKVTMRPWGSIETATNAIIALHQFHPKDALTVVAAAVQNPIHTALVGFDLLRERLPRQHRWIVPDPHNYTERMREAASFLSAPVSGISAAATTSAGATTRSAPRHSRRRSVRPR